MHIPAHVLPVFFSNTASSLFDLLLCSHLDLVESRLTTASGQTNFYVSDLQQGYCAPAVRHQQESACHQY